MWSEYFRIFISILLSVAFMFMFGFENIQKYIEGGTTIIRDQVFSKHKDIPLPGRIVDFKMSSCIRYNYQYSLWRIQQKWMDRERCAMESLILWAVWKMIQEKLSALGPVSTAIWLAT